MENKEEMDKWNSSAEFSRSNYQRVLICPEDKFIVIGQYVNGNYHDTRYGRKLTESIINGNFYWMPLPSSPTVTNSIHGDDLSASFFELG